MKTDYDTVARKRPVKLTLNEDLISQAREPTGNLSNVAKTLRAEFVREGCQKRAESGRALRATVANWNAFNAEAGSFADEYSTLSTNC